LGFVDCRATVPKIIRVGAQSTLGGHDILYGKICKKNKQNARILHDSCPKNYQNTEILYFPEKLNKILEFYTIFARKMPEIYIIARKIFFRDFLVGGGTCPLSPTPVPKMQMEYTI